MILGSDNQNSLSYASGLQVFRLLWTLCLHHFFYLMEFSSGLVLIVSLSSISCFFQSFLKIFVEN